MAKVGGYSISDIYQGGYSSFDPNNRISPQEYNLPISGFGLTTDPRNAHILNEVPQKLSTGVKHIEVEGLQPDVLESIPYQYLKEANRLGKLTGVDMTLHGPLVEASGLSRDGFNESNREASERQIFNAIEKAHILNPEGNAPITFHSSVSIPANIIPSGKKQPEDVMVINMENGGIGKLPIKERFFPGQKGFDANQELENYNQQAWSGELTNLGFSLRKSEEALHDSQAKYVKHAIADKIKRGEEISQAEKTALSNFNLGKTYLEDSYRRFKEVFNSAYSNAKREGHNEDIETLNKLSQNINNRVGEIEKIDNKDSIKKIDLMVDVIDDGLSGLSNLKYHPRIYRKLDEFAKEKTAETFANAALKSFEKVKKGEWQNAPIISIENPPYGGAFSTGEELKDLIDQARDKFIKKATAPKSDGGMGMSKSSAEAEAKKLLGVTWDVGHINMMRKYGYEKEDILKETEKIKPYLKHVHLSDNFGYEHTELPMGMGNVPIKEIMSKLGKEGYNVEKVIEAGNWWQHFKVPPVQQTFESFGSPFYSGAGGPYWNQAPGLSQDYSSGLAGYWLPQTNFDTWGGGFSQLPAELGGVKPGAGTGRTPGRTSE